MSKSHSEPHSHHHHDDAAHSDHHHGESDHGTPSLSRKEKLIKRLEVHIHHNEDHAGYYDSLVNEAVELGGEQAAQLLRAAAELTARQNENIEKALSLLRAL